VGDYEIRRPAASERPQGQAGTASAQETSKEAKQRAALKPGNHSARISVLPPGLVARSRSIAMTLGPVFQRLSIGPDTFRAMGAAVDDVCARLGCAILAYLGIDGRGDGRAPA